MKPARWRKYETRLIGWRAAALALASTHPAHALFGVGDIVFDPTLEAEQRLSNLKSAASWVQQARDMVQQYRMLENQYQAIAHLPQQAMNLARNLTRPPACKTRCRGRIR